MHTAISITLFFAAATSLLGAGRNATIALSTGDRLNWLGAAIAVLMTVWLTICGAWLLFNH